MSDLNEFLRELSAAKKVKKEHQEEAKKELGDFLSVVAEAKAQDPKHQLMKEVKKHVQEDIADLFGQLAQAKPVAVEKIDELVEAVELIEEIEPVQEQVMLTEVEVPEVKPASEIHSQAEIEKYLKRDASFQQPQPDKADPNIRALQDKLKFLEQAVGRIAATGPGSGEVNFRWLDDVNRATMAQGNDNWVLEYDSTTGKVQFTEHIGAIRSVKFNTAGPQQALVAGQMAYNNDEDCFDFKHNDGTILQGGLEQHIRVHNHTETNITNGTVVMFAGVENTNEVAMPIVGKYIADSASSPLLLIGVLTTDLTPGGTGRATTFGYVRDLNTTGSDVGETWLQGDLLWGHPTQAGKMTKVRPTAPNVATSIAAVVRVGTTDGQLLVRPTIFPRLYFASFASDQDQTHDAINTGKVITFNTNIITSGFTTINGGGAIKALNAGLYNFKFSLQVESSNASAKNFWIWIRKNGQDVPLSARKTSISGSGTLLVPSWNYQVSMAANDTFELMWAADSTSIRLHAPTSTAFCPSTPSATLAISQVNL